MPTFTAMNHSMDYININKNVERQDDVHVNRHSTWIFSERQKTH